MRDIGVRVLACTELGQAGPRGTLPGAGARYLPTDCQVGVDGLNPADHEPLQEPLQLPPRRREGIVAQHRMASALVRVVSDETNHKNPESDC